MCIPKARGQLSCRCPLRPSPASGLEVRGLFRVLFSSEGAAECLLPEPRLGL